MSVPAVTLHAVIKPDGSLELGERLALSPGRVQVTIVPLPELPPTDPFWQRMQALCSLCCSFSITPTGR